MAAATRDPVAVNFHGLAAPMASADVTAAATKWGCEAAMVRAVLDVESSGTGYDTAKRPKALFEPHWFFRELQAKPAVQSMAVQKGLAYPVQGTRPYPKTSDAVYQQILQACALDPVSALQSTSWGIAQVMGLNYAICGYADVVTMVLDCMDSEAKQFGLLVAYFDHEKLVPALKSKDFLTIATRYNGPGAAAAYAAKLKAAYQHHAAPVVQKPTPLQIITQPWSFDRPALNTTDQLADTAWLTIRAGLTSAPSAASLNAIELKQMGAPS